MTDALKHIDNSEKQDFTFLFTRDIEFRQETIYFIVVDRFYDGDPTNNEGKNPELYDPKHQDWGKYWGGDLQGVIDKLDYLKNMGVTAIWLTPLFEQIEFLSDDRAAMHGYWTSDFKRINPRYIGAQENPSLFKAEHTVFDTLIEEMHVRGMKLVLDIVCNHSSPSAEGEKGKLYDDGELIADFNNDVNHWYHHYGEVTNWEDEWQVQNKELAGLADFNENNPEYRQYIKSAIKLWLDRGVDVLRVDTVKHMPIWFWQEFCSDITAHKPQVFLFGEWIFSHPEDQHSTNFANHSGMTILDFALCIAVRNAITEHSELGFQEVQQVFDLDHKYHGATELVTFIDNHDMPRFQTLNPDQELLRLAIDLIMTARGIPCIYYGTEQYLYDNTDGGNDPYNRPMMEQWDEQTAIYQDVQQLSQLRRTNPAVALGSQKPQLVTRDVFCYTRMYRESRCFVALNQGEQTLLEQVTTDLADGTYTCLLTRRQIQVQQGQIHNLELGSKEGIVLSYIGQHVESTVVVKVQVNNVATEPSETVVVIGDCPELGEWDLNKAYPLEYINANTWFGEIPFDASAGKLISFKYAVVSQGKAPRYENTTVRRWVLPEQGSVKWRDTWK